MDHYSIDFQTVPATQGTPQQPAAPGPYYPAYRSDPLAADRPGEELLPEASVWQIYKKEANDYDNELVKGRNENLDTMLIFAALFSAILAAFLMESMSLLEEDPAETSAALLLILVKSQLGANVSSAPLDDLSFVPTPSARWVNGLWFAALALSLAAALLAMLAKEWLDSFTTSHKRAPYAFAITRQARLDGFEGWYAPHIMDLLPTLLHLSLLLFALGLVVYLWRLDQAVAIMLSAAICLTFLLYLGTIICGAYYQLCPFVTRLSRYLQAGLRLSRKTSGGCFDDEKLGSSDYTTVADVRALVWLAKNARDQESSKSAYQALAGLRQRPMSGPPQDQSTREYKKWLAHQHDVARYFEGFSLCFESTLVDSPRELAKHKGESVIRYARALPDIVTHMGTVVGKLNGPPSTQPDRHAQMELMDTANKTLVSIFRNLDMLWNGKCALNACAYAYVAATELRLIQTTTENPVLENLSQSQPTLGEVAEESSGVIVDMSLATQWSIQRQPAKVLSRYEASLACSMFLISGHIDSGWGICLNNPALLNLITAVETTTVFILHQPYPYSMFSHDRYINHSIQCQSGGIEFQSVFPTALSTLIELASTSHLDLTPAVMCASARAIYALGLLRKRGLDGSDHVAPNPNEVNDLAIYSFKKGLSGAIKWVSRVAGFAISHDPLFELLEPSLSLLLKLAASACSSELEYFAESKEPVFMQTRELALLIMQAKKSIASWSGPAKGSLVKILAQKLLHRRPEECQSIWGNTFPFPTHGSQAGLLEPVQALLFIIQQVPNHSPEVSVLLDDLVKQFSQSGGSSTLISTGSISAALEDNPYLKYFTANLGFSELAKIGRNASYALSVAKTFVKLCTSSHFQAKKAVDLRERLLTRFGRIDHEDIWGVQEGMNIFEEYQASHLVPYTQTVSPIAMPGFLVTLSIALDHLQMGGPDGTTNDNISYFVECVTKLLNVSIIASQGDFDEACCLKAGEVARRLCQYGAPQLEKEAAALITQYDQYSELQTKTEEEIETLQVESVHSEIDEGGSANPRTPMLD